MISKWYAINLKTGEIAIATEPIHFKQFLIESGFARHNIQHIHIGRSKQTVKRMLGVIL